MEAPRSYLFVTWEGGGNVPPVLGVARRLGARGHRVRVLAEPCLQPDVERAGVAFVPFRQHFTRTDRHVDLIRDAEVASPVAKLKRVLDRVIIGPLGLVAQETADALATEPADVVVADAMMLGAVVAAEAAAVPCVMLFHMPEYLPGPGKPAAGPGFLPHGGLLGRLRDGLFNRLLTRTLDSYTPAVNAVRARWDLAPMASPVDLFHGVERRLIQTTAAFDFPITPAPANVRYVGPVLDDPAWTAPWVNPWDDDDPRPLVVVSLSSTYQDQRRALQRGMDALGALGGGRGLDGVRGLVTLGPAMANERFDVPANVMAVPSASHAQVFPHAAAVVTHAGHGTLMRALAHGLPVVCLPMGRDQDDNAARVAYHGAGLRLKPSASAARIERAVGRVLTEPAFRAGAARLQRAIAADVADDRAVRELEAVAAALVPAAMA